MNQEAASYACAATASHLYVPRYQVRPLILILARHALEAVLQMTPRNLEVPPSEKWPICDSDSASSCATASASSAGGGLLPARASFGLHGWFEGSSGLQCGGDDWCMVGDPAAGEPAAPGGAEAARALPKALSVAAARSPIIGAGSRGGTCVGTRLDKEAQLRESMDEGWGKRFGLAGHWDRASSSEQSTSVGRKCESAAITGAMCSERGGGGVQTSCGNGGRSGAVGHKGTKGARAWRPSCMPGAQRGGNTGRVIRS
jgi:hypothetical protein